jgi:hypothetical protein
VLTLEFSDGSKAQIKLEGATSSVMVRDGGGKSIRINAPAPCEHDQARIRCERFERNGERRTARARLSFRLRAVSTPRESRTSHCHELDTQGWQRHDWSASSCGPNGRNLIERERSREVDAAAGRQRPRRWHRCFGSSIPDAHLDLAAALDKEGVVLGPLGRQELHLVASPHAPEEN